MLLAVELEQEIGGGKGQRDETIALGAKRRDRIRSAGRLDGARGSRKSDGTVLGTVHGSLKVNGRGTATDDGDLASQSGGPPFLASTGDSLVVK
ncbi:MAG TPA: hypothetical protein VFS04_07450 [Alphaproteobacteria bacterium]|nr:hypothetical protein [Alphaproteobacteria bacterium]